MSGSARKISQTFNGRKEWQIGGAHFFKLLTTINPVDVELYDKGGVRLVAAQVEGGFYQRIEFDRVVISTGANEQVEWMFAPDEAGSDRFTGNVSVLGAVDVSDRVARLLGRVDGTFADGVVAANQAFIRGGSIGPTAAQYSQVQIHNPAASGKVVLVDKVTVIGEAAAMDAYLRHYDTALTTDVGAGYNKNAGGAAGVGHIRTASGVAHFGTEWLRKRMPAGQGAEIELKPPARLEAGEGLLVANNTVNIICQATFEWREQ